MTAQASNVARNVVLSCRLLPESVGTLGLGSSCCRSIPAWNHFGFEQIERGKKQMPCVCPKLTDETCLKDGSCAPKASFRVFLRQTGSGSGPEPFWSGPCACIRIASELWSKKEIKGSNATMPRCHDATMPRSPRFLAPRWTGSVVPPNRLSFRLRMT